MGKPVSCPLSFLTRALSSDLLRMGEVVVARLSVGSADAIFLDLPIQRPLADAEELRGFLAVAEG